MFTNGRTNSLKAMPCYAWHDMLFTAYTARGRQAKQYSGSGRARVM